MLTPAMIANFMREQCKTGIAKPHEIHRKILHLGPTCYVTTNYDKLIEGGFNRWQPDSYYRTVVNNQLTEMVDIIGARADHFVFKLHGDVDYADSIILTKEHYRALNPGGEFNSALETVKTLQLSRSFIATEKFVTEHLLPLYPSDKSRLQHNLTELLTRLGKKLGRRYIAT
jgi:hypothetical protein